MLISFVDLLKKSKYNKVFRRIYYFIKNLPYLFAYIFSQKRTIKQNGLLLFVHDLERQGTQTLIYNIAKKFISMNINVCVISPKIGPYWSDFVAVVPLIIAKGKKLERLVKVLKEYYGYNKAICNSVMTIEAIPILKKYDYRVISLIHEMNMFITEQNLAQKCRDILPKVDLVIFPSTIVYKSFCDNCVKDGFKYQIRNQGLYNEKLANINLEQARKWIINHFGFDSDVKIITNGANASYIKGFDYFLDIAYIAKNKFPNYKFLWIGKNAETIFNEKLKQYNLKKFDNVILPGYVSDLEILNRLYAGSDLFLLTSRQDSFPSVVLEAFMVKKPVIAFENCGGFQDIVNNNITGYLVKKFDTEECLDQISRLLSDKELMKSMGEKCRKVAEKHSFKNYCKYLLQILNN